MQSGHTIHTQTTDENNERMMNNNTPDSPSSCQSHHTAHTFETVVGCPTNDGQLTLWGL